MFPLIGWLEVTSIPPSIVAPATGFSATFAPSYATFAVIDLPFDDGGPDSIADASEDSTPTEAPVSIPAPAPDVALAEAPIACVQPFPLIPSDRIENEQAVADSINAERLRYGLLPMILAAELTQSARLHSRDMAENNMPSHYGSDGSDPSQRMSRACYEGASWGEIIAWGFGDAASAMGWWMNSPVHRAEILTPGFRDLGVGYFHDPDNGYRHYWTVNFGSPDPILRR